MSLNNLSELISLFPNSGNIEKLNLKDEKDYKKFNTIVDDLESQFKGNSFLSSIFGKDVFDSIRNLAEICHNANTQDSDVENCDYNCAECEKECHTPEEEDVCEDKENNSELIFPSAKIENIDIMMQIHRLTQEYVDTMLKPYMEKGPNTTNNINNAYTALFEFACWIYSHK